MNVSSESAADGAVTLTVPAAAPYLEMVVLATEAAARLAGFGPNSAGRARLIAEEIFQHVIEQACLVNRPAACLIRLGATPDGMIICFITDHLAFDPQSVPDYSLEEVLAGDLPQGLGLHLVKAYAQSITLTRKGPQRELCIRLARHEKDYGSRPWYWLVPSLAAGLTLTPMQHKGRRIHRLDGAADGKSYLVRSLAHVVLNLMDGRQSFGWIMAQARKVVPERNWHEVEDLCEVMIERGLVSLREIPPEQAEIQVQDQPEPAALRALRAYQKTQAGD